MANSAGQASRGRALVPALVLVMALLAAGVVVALTGWGGGSSPAAGGNDSFAGSDDPLVGRSYYANPAAVCGLLDPQDLEVVLGRAYGEGFEPPLEYPVFAGMTGVVRCTYSARESSEAFSIGVVYAYADQVYDDRLEQNEKIGEVSELSGLGDRAVWSDAPKELMVDTGDKVVVAQLADSTEAKEVHVERVRRLAEKALDRLR